MIGKYIRQRRQELGLTQEELAKKTGYTSKAAINKIEKEINDIPQSKISLFASALDVDVMYFFKHDTPTVPPNVEAYIKKFLELSAEKQDAVGKYIEFMAREDN